MAATEASGRVYRLADALVLLLLLMLPVMLVLGAAEGRPGAPTALFWLLLLLPLILVAWLLTCCEPEETSAGPRVAALHVPRDAAVAAAFESLVASFVRPRRSYVEAGVPVTEGIPQVRASQLFSQLERHLAPHQVIPLVEELEGGAVRVIGLPKGVDGRLRSGSSPVINLVLLAATVVTTVYAGARQQGVNLLESPGQFAVGLPYAMSLLSVLGVHELGHYFMARRHGVDVTLPYFIPVPMGLGTFGAVHPDEVADQKPARGIRYRHRRPAGGSRRGSSTPLRRHGRSTACSRRRRGFCVADRIVVVCRVPISARERR